MHHEIFGEFYGHDLSYEECEERTLLHINPKFLDKEADLFKTKWFDYRFMHPMMATYLYAHLYTQGYRRAFQRIKDVDRGKYVLGFSGSKDFLDKKERGGFWKGRQKADELGIPYFNYINYAIEYCLNRLWHRIPRPSQLYSKECVEHIVQRWQEDLAAATIEPLLPYFRNRENRFDEHHIECQKWICERLTKRRHPYLGLSHFMFTDPIVSKDVALQYFDQDVLNRAKSESLD